MYNMEVLGFYFLAIFVSLSFGDDSKRILMTDATYVQQLEQTIQTLKANMADMTTQVADLTTKLTASDHKVQTLTSTVADLTSKQTGSGHAVQNLTSNVADLTTKLIASDNTVQTLASKVADVTTKVTAPGNIVQNLTAKITELTTKLAATGSGGSYVRWGKSYCPSNTSDLVYSGYAGASWYDDPGRAVNSLCMSNEPEWQTDNQIVLFDDGPRIYGVEYFHPPGKSNAVNYDDVPCAVCRSHQPTVVMIPGRRTCYPGWTTEYKGYIVAGNRLRKATQYVCLDEDPEPVPHGSSQDNGGFFEPTTAHCGSLTCPPYKENKIVMCVVCSK